MPTSVPVAGLCSLGEPPAHEGAARLAPGASSQAVFWAQAPAPTTRASGARQWRQQQQPQQQQQQQQREQGRRGWSPLWALENVGSCCWWAAASGLAGATFLAFGKLIWRERARATWLRASCRPAGLAAGRPDDDLGPSERAGGAHNGSRQADERVRAAKREPSEQANKQQRAPATRYEAPAKDFRPLRVRAPRRAGA